MPAQTLQDKMRKLSINPASLLAQAADRIDQLESALEGAVAKEREECAKICDEHHYKWRWDNEPDSASGPRECASSIRARGDHHG